MNCGVHIDNLREPRASILRIPEQLHEEISGHRLHKTTPVEEFPVFDRSLMDSSLAEEAISLLSSRFPFKSPESITKAVNDALAFFAVEKTSETTLGGLSADTPNGM